ncbi:MAG: glutamine--tRNA ligase/YqeY domain fusion protein [Flavobacteriaceae bacterium]|jgi:glutaminyl-tRNA synthetase|nr:glutamine--tRNA ligase/YqeY domain fusion protein [Flavobacteriaceae bacterium]MBT3918853.1 glutamine--tRNA ligase/YqeY domain fusion protein [Flavobacteriaceae bacterium]MBT7242005.1 glutamine--tRNA ligase/YqeY domain fusion protein [Flavobacteriaceae bacterium]|tara:strand:+ start:3075 stop:5102 length:2028 start_codon:yes stop_codon:yes gene_type:complete
MLEKKIPLNFIEHIIEEDLANGMPKENLRFRFPPEPNGYLHIGHTKAIGISFGLGEKYDAPVNLRFDDTNPAKEEQKYVDAIKKDIAWMGYQWDQELYSSDYFQKLYDWAIRFIKNGKAYIDSQSSEEMRNQKGTPTQVGTNSPYRNRPIEENLDLFAKMKEGAFSEGTHVLRAKIDMEDPNMLMRDPIMYRVLKKTHHRTGNDWCVFPMYDWTHGESDYIEQISHSLCSLEFKPHRKLYDWFRDEVYSENLRELPLAPKQREFARLNLSYTIMSKRKLLQLVEEKVVNGWDDPRMPTISGLRRRGYTSNAIKKFIDAVGVAKRENVIDVSLLEFCIREDLNKTAPRVMAVLNPVKLIITNYPEDKEELLKAETNPEDKNAGFREVPFSKELYIEREDFKEAANNNFFRLSLGKEVRLKNAYIIKADSVLKDSQGNITELLCSYDADSLSGRGTEASIRKVKGTLHWVSIAHALKTEIRSYDRLFTDEAPDSHKDKTFMDFINPNSLKVTEAFVEPSLASAKKGDSFQFQRLGYFNVDDDTTSENIVFNKTVGLRDSWAKKKPTQIQVEQAQIPQVSPVNEIMRFGKKYTKLPIEKQELAKIRIQELATNISYDELTPFFGTALKKVGTRIVTMISLGVLLKITPEITPEIKEFVTKALEDKDELLVLEAKKITF